MYGLKRKRDGVHNKNNQLMLFKKKDRYLFWASYHTRIHTGWARCSALYYNDGAWWSSITKDIHVTTQLRK